MTYQTLGKIKSCLNIILNISCKNIKLLYNLVSCPQAKGVTCPWDVGVTFTHSVAIWISHRCLNLAGVFRQHSFYSSARHVLYDLSSIPLFCCKDIFVWAVTSLQPCFLFTIVTSQCCVSCTGYTRRSMTSTITFPPDRRRRRWDWRLWIESRESSTTYGPVLRYISSPIHKFYQLGVTSLIFFSPDVSPITRCEKNQQLFDENNLVCQERRRPLYDNQWKWTQSCREKTGSAIIGSCRIREKSAQTFGESRQTWMNDYHITSKKHSDTHPYVLYT